jgi:hypothetical protein
MPRDEQGRLLPPGAIAIEHRRRGERGELVHHAGVVLEQPTPSVVRTVTWNTNNLDKHQNVSHAEHHFVTWLLGQPDLSTVDQIHLNLRYISPCSACAADLIKLARTIRAAGGAAFASRGRAVLTWIRPYLWTFKSEVDSLIDAGWVCHAPPVPEGDPLRGARIIIVPPTYRPPR